MTKTRDEDIQSGYFQWLCELIYINQEHKSYFILAKALQRKEFYALVPNDDNRAEDGKLLRDRYEEEIGIHVDGRLGGPCTMLEMLIALSYRCEALESSHSDCTTMHCWFWKLMGNVGLDKFTDENYLDFDGREMIEIILEKIVSRSYHRNGRGSLFPLKHHKKDMRKVELWYQMAEYFMENYYTKD